MITAKWLSSLACVALLTACNPARNTDASADVIADGGTASVGQDLDERNPRQLASSYTLPPAFDTALQALSVAPASLNFTDLGLTFVRDSTRLHWTDAVRHQGAIAPRFGYMVIEDVEAAMALGDTPERARELLVAQATYQDRMAFVSSRYDRRVTVSATGQPLLDALRAFVAHAPVLPDGAQPAAPSWPEVETQVRRFSQPAQIAIAQCIGGLLLAADLRDRALTQRATMTLSQWDSNIAEYDGLRGQPMGYTLSRTMGEAMDFELLSRAGQLAVRSVESLRIALRAEPLAADARVQVDGPLGRILLSLQPTDDTYESQKYFLLVDAGGNDTYHDDIAVNQDITQPVSVLLDMAGDDHYQPSFNWQISRLGVGTATLVRQGTGQFGVAVLDDAAGADVYISPSSSQGYGLFGVGVLLDHAGADSYKAYAYSQGAAEFGYGLLMDVGAGADQYETWTLSQGFAGTRGIGWLVDDGGNDRYLAIEDPIVENWANEGTNFSGSQGFGFGSRILPQGPYLSGGLGALFDLAGDDQFQCAVMCQGFGYFFGTGLFYDKAGADRHVVTHKYGIGAATHQSVGLFIDGQGADTYSYVGHGRTGGGEGVGLGYDQGVAFHIDRGNESDRYEFLVDVGHIMGYARHPALGVLINEGGSDEYHIAGMAAVLGMGVSNAESADRAGALGMTRTPSVGIFLDLGGVGDVYDLMHMGANNHATWVQTTMVGPEFNPMLDHGYGFDSE
jgi:hypothetical protein